MLSPTRCDTWTDSKYCHKTYCPSSILSLTFIILDIYQNKETWENGHKVLSYSCPPVKEPVKQKASGSPVFFLETVNYKPLYNIAKYSFDILPQGLSSASSVKVNTFYLLSVSIENYDGHHKDLYRYRSTQWILLLQL